MNRDAYAIIKCGGKQYRVQKDDVIDIELVDKEKGSQLEFGEILFINDGKDSLIGNPHLGNYFVHGELLDFVKGPKITSVKYQPGNHYRKFGHRQKYCHVKITDIGLKHHKGEHHGT
jgi:large subunit ribosomal protein L21